MTLRRRRRSTNYNPLFLLPILALISACTIRNDEGGCLENIEREGLSQEQVDQILDGHQTWLDNLPIQPDDKAQGSRADFSRTILRDLSLEGDLAFAIFRNADLRDVDFVGSSDSKRLERAEFECAILTEVDLSKWNLRGADFRHANLTRAQLVKADLEGADLSSANLTRAQLVKADLEGADLSSANLTRAQLVKADLEGADLPSVILTKANLESADLTGADLTSAKLDGSIIKDAYITDTVLRAATYAPVGAPSKDHVARIEGLDTVTIPERSQDGMVKLRELLRQSGFRTEERQATFSIESNLARHDMNHRSPFKKISGELRWVLFGLTTAWGKHPARALGIMLGVAVGAAIFYGWAIAKPSAASRSSQHGVFIVWRKDRLEPGLVSGLLDQGKAEIVSVGPGEISKVFLWAAYFSIVSAFHIGWRDLNVGAWIGKVQHKEYTLRGFGWVRSLSGIQSFVSVYLLAIWALTYFGRPFQ